MSITHGATSAPMQSTYELELTIISGKHLKNVNWKNGDLKPYAIFWVDPDNNKLTTKSDDSGNTKPVWNQRFIIPINSPLSGSSFSLEIFHSKSSETPKPFVGSLHVSLSDLPDPTNGSLIRTFILHRPSGRPQGKIRLKLSLKEHPLQPVAPNYQNAPVNPYYYSSAPPYPPFISVTRSSPATAYPYSYSGGWPTQPRPYCAPSAPVEYGQSQTRVGGVLGSGSGFAVGAMAGALGGMTLDEGLRREEAKMGERVGESSGVRDDFSDYRGEC